MLDKPESCCVDVPVKGMFGRWTKCTRKGIVEGSNGQLYCKQHSPEAKERRDKIADEKHKKKTAEFRLKLAGPEMLDALEFVQDQMSRFGAMVIENPEVKTKIREIRVLIAKAKGDE